MIAIRNYLAFLPLSNWLAMHDRYGQALDKRAVPESKFPDCWYVLASDAPPEQVRKVLAKTQALVDRLGIPGDRVVRVESMLPTGEDGAQPNTFTGTGVGWRWPAARLPIERQGWVDESGNLLLQPHEAITAQAYHLKLASLSPWSTCSPRSFSVLPIARACNASCAFCFSKASVSKSIIPSGLSLEVVRWWASKARKAGAQRAVITGGGEPGLLGPQAMADLVACLGEDYSSVLLITNASLLVRYAHKHGPAQAVLMLSSWKEAGLSRVAVSRHGVDAATDSALMGLSVDGGLALSLIRDAGLGSRSICVLQRGGVETPQHVRQYLERAAAEGTNQVCFKELYVSALSENPLAPSAENQYCQANQVPLSMAMEALEALGFVVSGRLPWGSPVYQGQTAGVNMSVAAYTEPSVGWERRHGLVRSWNLLASGQCLASLEDPASVLNNPSQALSPRPAALPEARAVG